MCIYFPSLFTVHLVRSVYIQLFQTVTSWAAEAVLAGWHETARAWWMGMGFYKTASRRVIAVADVTTHLRRRPAASVYGGPCPQWPGHHHLDGSQLWYRRGRFRVPVLRLGVTLICTLFFRKTYLYIIDDLQIIIKCDYNFTKTFRQFLLNFCYVSPALIVKLVLNNVQLLKYIQGTRCFNKSRLK